MKVTSLNSNMFRGRGLGAGDSTVIRSLLMSTLVLQVGSGGVWATVGRGSVGDSGEGGVGDSGEREVWVTVERECG